MEINRRGSDNSSLILIFRFTPLFERKRREGGRQRGRELRGSKIREKQREYHLLPHPPKCPHSPRSEECKSSLPPGWQRADG